MIKQELSEMYWKYVLSYYLLFYSVWLQRWFEAIWMDQIIRKNGEKENSEQKQTSRVSCIAFLYFWNMFSA